MLNKIEYLAELESELKHLNKKDRADYLRYYRQRIDSELDTGAVEEKVISKMPSPRSIASNIYREKGIDYITKQRQKMKVASMLFIFLSVLMILGIIWISGTLILYLGKLMINMLTLYPSFFTFSLVDAFLSVLFLTTYFLISLIMLLMIVEIVLFIIRVLIYKVTDIFLVKDVDLEAYSIFHWVNKWFKKTNVIFKVFGLLCVVMLATGVLGYFNRTYIYRVLHNEPLVEELHELDIDGITKLSIQYDTNEVRLAIMPTDGAKIELRYMHEFDHKFSFTIENGVLVLTSTDILTYDAFSVLKEPVPYIYLKIPKSLVLGQVDFDVAYGGVILKQTNVTSFDVNMLSGYLTIENSNLTNANIRISKVTYASDANVYDKLELHFNTGNFTLGEDMVKDMSVENAYAVGVFNKTTFTGEVVVDNTSGEYTGTEAKFNNLTFNTKSGKLYLKDYQIKVLKYSGSGIGDISLYRGSHELVDINSNEGIVYMVEVAGNAKIEGRDLTVHDIDQKSGSLEIKQDRGRINLRNNLELQNKLTSFKCNAIDADITISNIAIDNMEINMGRSIVLIDETYGISAKIKVESGDLNFVNTDKSQQFESFEATINLGTRNVDVGTK